MEQLKLQLDDLKQTLTGVDGELYFTVGAKCFPGEYWREPVSVVLEQWIPGFLSFMQGHTDVCLMEFMDGPYAVKLNRDNFATVRGVFLRDSPRVGTELPVDLRELTQSVLKALRTYDRNMHQWGHPPRWIKEQAVLNQLLKHLT